MKKIFIGLIIILLLIGVCFVVNNSINSGDDSQKYNITIKKPDTIEAKAYFSTVRNQLIISATNNSGKTIGSATVYVKFYNENDEEIEHEFQRIGMLENGEESVVGYYTPNTMDIEHYIPAKTEVEIKINEEYQKTYSNDINDYFEAFEYSYEYSSDDSQKLNIITKNITDKPAVAPRTVSVVFYKNNKPISVIDNWVGYYKTCEPGETIINEVSIHEDYVKSRESESIVPLDYDSIKIFKVVY